MGQAAVGADDQRISALEAELGAFSYIVSHDLQTTLRQVKGFVGLLERELAPDLPDRQRNFLDRISQAADSGQALIEGLGVYSRAQQRPLNPVLTNADAVFATAWLSLSEVARPRQAELLLEPLGQAMMDPRLVAEAIAQVLGNAIKFTPDDVRPMVFVRRVAEANDWVVHVIDKGVGVAPEQREKVFEMFHRLKPDDNSSVGVGLTIARRIFRRHGGDVRLVDFIGGACVELRLPSAD